jgi:hypothetical protein
MCDYLGDKRHNAELGHIAPLIEKGVEGYPARGENLPADRGGSAQTGEITDRIIQEMGAKEHGECS